MEDDGRRVLVLNRLWQPVNIIGARRAFSLLSQGNAQVINTADGSFRGLDLDAWIDYSVQNPPRKGEPAVHTVRFALRIPAVVLLQFYDRAFTKNARFSRRSILERDQHTCQYCGRSYSDHELTLDHVIPRDQGGQTSWENIVTCCIYCNSEKANRLPHQAGMKLAKPPARPKPLPFAAEISRNALQPEWAHFIKS